MSETTPPTAATSGRVRRRASRRAGPVTEHDEVGVSPGGAAAVDAGPVDALQPDAPAEGKTAGTASALAADASAKHDAAEDVSTAKLRRSGAGSAVGSSGSAVSSTAERGKADADATVKTGKADADATVKTGTVDSAGVPGEADSAAPRDAELADTPVDAPVDEDAAGEGEAADADDNRGFWRSMRPVEWIAAAVAIVALIALVGGGVTYFYHQRHVDALAAERAEYVQTAKQAILNLTNIKDDTAKQDIDRVLSVASGDLKAEYSERKDAYAQVVQQAKVRASGAVIEAAIESENSDSAQVLVAAKQTLTNAGDQQPQDRYYRFRVTVNRGDDGVTASKVEFVA